MMKCETCPKLELTEEDRQGYETLKNQLKKFAGRTNKEQLAKNFEAILDYTKFWIGNNPARADMCGIVWDGNSLAISTRRFCTLINKCKSSVNAGLQALGYKSCPMTAKHVETLLRHFPYLRDDCSEMRQWTIRELAGKSSETIIDTPENMTFNPDLMLDQDIYDLFQEFQVAF